VTKLKAWLGATARNKAKNKLRKVRDDITLDEETLAGGSYEIEDAVISSYERGAVRAAILKMDEPDREIFLRHYFSSQTVATIVSETGMTEHAVKHRLVRGRKKLGAALSKEVFEA